MHVRIGLPQVYMFTAMDRIRVNLLDVVRKQLGNAPARLEPAATALNQIMDLARAILFLASDEASYTTGSVLDVTGGR